MSKIKVDRLKRSHADLLSNSYASRKTQDKHMKNFTAKSLLFAGSSIFVLASSVAIPTAANAIGIVWTLNNVNFTSFTQNNTANPSAVVTSGAVPGSGIASGSFIYDTVTGTISNVNIGFVAGGLTTANGTTSEVFTITTAISSIDGTKTIFTATSGASTNGPNTTTQDLGGGFSLDTVKTLGTDSELLQFTFDSSLDTLTSKSVTGVYTDTYSDSTTTNLFGPVPGPGISLQSSSTTTNVGTIIGNSSGGTLVATPVPFEFDATAGLAVLGGAWLFRNHLRKKKSKV